MIVAIRPAGESSGDHFAFFAHGPENRAARDPRGKQPPFQSLNRAERRVTAGDGNFAALAFLVGFASANGDGDACSRSRDILEVKRDKLGPTKRTRESDQQERPIANLPDRVPSCFADRSNSSATSGATLF